MLCTVGVDSKDGQKKHVTFYMSSAKGSTAMSSDLTMETWKRGLSVCVWVWTSWKFTFSRARRTR